MLRKIATLETLEAYRVPAHADARALRKAAHRVSFEYTPRPGYLYVRSRAISSRCNDNFDEFPAEEIAKAYATFKGKPVFVNHHNDDHRRMRGVIIDAALHQDRNPDGTPDTWAEVLMEVDAKTFPKLAKAILAGEVDRTSMGCDVQLSVCSACGNKATNPAEYCQHIPAMKGQRIFRATASGQREGHLVREICYGLGFFENSLLVEEPADPTAYFLGVDDRGMRATATQHGEEPPGWINDVKDQADELASRNGHSISWKYRGEPQWKSSSGYVAGWQGECANDGCDAPASQTSRAHTDKVRTISIREDQPGELKDMMPPFLRRRCKGTTVESSRKTAAEDHWAMPIFQHLKDAHGLDDDQIAEGMLAAGAEPNMNQGIKLDHLFHAHKNLHGGDYQTPTGAQRHGHTPEDPLISSEFRPSRMQMNQSEIYNDKPAWGPRSLGPYRMRADEYGDFKPLRQSQNAKTADVRHNPQYEGTHCLMCGDPVRWNSNPAKQSLPSGGWYHHDSIKRDHHALPADPEAVMNDVPRQDAQRDQIDAQIREQYGFGPKRHKDMPLDPFVSAYAPELDELGPVEAAAGPKYPDPADHPFFKKNPINHQHIVDTYNESDEGTRAQGKRWYPDAHILAKAIDPEGNAARGAGVLSAYSPQTSWPVNAMNAARSLQRGKAMQKGEGQIMASHAKSAQRIIEGEHHSDVFKGPKIRAFAHLIEHGGDDHSVVVDRHALSVAMGKRVSKDDLADAPLSTPHYYGHVERAYQDAAKQLSGQHGETIHPHEVQATTWLQQQKRNAVDNETARGGQGKGLITRDKNDWRDWENYHQKNHPDLPKSLHTTNPHAPKTEAMRKGAPFAGYEDFAACVAANQDKDDPEAYCGSIKHKVEGAQHTAAHRVYVDQAEGSHGRMVTFSGEDKGGYLSRGDGTWMAENDNGSVVHEHRDHKRALRGLADHYGLTGDLDVEYTHEGTGNRKNFTVPGKTAALNDVVAPPEVDTLRDEECPVCGEVEVYDGERCPVCGFVAPPEMFRDPDLEMAKSIDLRQDQQAQAGDPAPGQANPDVPGGGLVDPSQLGDDPLADQLQHPDQLGPNGEMGEPGTPGDGTPDLFCPACGEGFDAGQPMTTDGDPATLDASGPAEGTPCPNCGMSTLLSPNDMEGMGIGPDGEQAVAEEAEEMGDRPMDAGTPEEDPEAPQEGEGPPEQQEEEGPPTEEDDDSDEPAVDEDDQPSKKRDDKNAKGASMSKSVEAALAANTAAVGSLMRELRIVRAQNDLIAKAAGLEGEFSEIRRQADINNPASPVPDPGEQAPSETTEEAVTPEAADDPQRPGMTPGSVGGVPAEQVDTPLRPGVTLPAAPATNLVDVTAPVAGTNTGELSPEQTRIETDVRVGDPMANANSDESKMFPWTIGAQNANRTMASMRLAELRIAANLAPAGDRFALAASIETDANLPDAALATEIRTLEAVSRTAARQPRPTNLVPRAAATEGRTAPSLAPQPVGAPVGGGGYDDTADSDLFF